MQETPHCHQALGALAQGRPNLAYHAASRDPGLGRRGDVVKWME